MKGAEACGHANLLNSILGLPGKRIVKENKNDEEYDDEQLQNPGRATPEP